MKILQSIIGFVTNSSSANYWLNDEVLEEWENSSSTNKVQNTEKENNSTSSLEDASKDIKETNLKQGIQEPVTDFSIWFVFSLILVLITIQRKIRK